jgi:hypothetical protein
MQDSRAGLHFICASRLRHGSTFRRDPVSIKQTAVDMNLLLCGKAFSRFASIRRIEYVPGELDQGSGRKFQRRNGVVVISVEELPQLTDWSLEVRGKVYPLELALAPYESDLGTVTTFAECIPLASG